MITCDQALELISAKIDGALSPAEHAALEDHLAMCPACRALLSDFEGMHTALADLADLTPAPPADLSATIMTQIHRAKRTPFQIRQQIWKRRSWASLAAVCAIALLGAGTLRFWNANSISAWDAAAPMMAQAQTGGGEAAAPAAAPPSALPQAIPAPDEAAGGAPVADSGGMYAAMSPPTPAPSVALTHGGETPEIGKQDMTADPVSVPTPAAMSAPTPAPTAPAVPTADLAGQAVSETPPLLQNPAPRMAAMSVYCGILTMPYATAPDLSGYKFIQTGTERQYLVPATDFAKLAETVQTSETATLSTAGDGVSSDAEQGLLIITAVPDDAP